MAQRLRQRLLAVRQALAPALPGFVAALLALLISQTGLWRELELKLFDRLVVASAANRVDLPITIVGIDEPSFAELGVQWPWPRELHGRLLDRLREAGAAVVAFDVVFAEPASAAGDRAFAEAIARHGRVVLAADLVYQESNSVRQWQRVEPLPQLTAAGALAGFASVEIDPDGVMRQVPAGAETLWHQALVLLEQQLPGSVAQLDAGADLRIRYLGGPHTFTYIPYYQLLEPEKYLPADWKDFLKDNVVLVGRNLKATTEARSAQADMFQTPFFHVGSELMPGVEVHANLIANMVAGNALREAPRSWSTLLWLFSAAAAATLMRRWRPWQSGFVAVALTAPIALAGYLLFTRPLVWLPAGGAILTVLLVYLSQGGAAFFREERQRREIKRAFAMYVAPALVEEVTAHPELLRLGGERRELTLLFSDLAGFTAISEALKPEQVAQLLNRHLGEMTEIILRHRGTVDKFIGDSVMAFWGAPLADAEQSARAVAAAIEMQQRLATSRRELLAAGGPELSMRIGLHRGECIVGNLGGDQRFAYTAIGDAVNLASRLEGANKAYGTDTLLSAAVAAALPAAIGLRQVDTARVKGKQSAIEIFTPCADARLAELSETALAAYRRGEWDAARDAWEAVRARWPDDPLARTFLDRLAAFERGGPPAEWDGVANLQTK